MARSDGINFQPHAAMNASASTRRGSEPEVIMRDVRVCVSSSGYDDDAGHRMGEWETPQDQAQVDQLFTDTS